MLAVLVAIPALHQVTAAPYDWASATTGGIWSDQNNWNPNTGVPGVGDIATLVDATADRTVTYDASAPSSLDGLAFDQSSGFLNELLVQRGFTLTNAVILGGTGGTERVNLLPTGTTSFTLAANGGITVNTGGELLLGGLNPSASGSSGTGNLSGNVTLAGGLLDAAALVREGTSNGNVNNTLNGTLTMSAGTLRVSNPSSSTITDRRLTVTGNIDITGGSVTTDRAGGIIQAQGVTNTLEPDSYDTNLLWSFFRNGDQSLATSAALGKVTSRGFGVKTLTSTEPDGRVGIITFIDGSTSGTQGTTLRLGSNLSSLSLPAAETFSQAVSAGRVDYGFDLQNFTLDLSGAPTGWTPNTGAGSGAITNAVWTLAGSGGRIRAPSFNFSGANISTEIGPGVIVEATGGDGTANILSSGSGNGTINATAVFRYAGTASQSAPATLESTRDVPTIEVTSGALNISSLNNASTVGVDVASGATLTVSNGVDDPGAANIFGGTFAAGSFVGFNTFAGDRSYANAITGTRGLSKYSNNTLTLGGANTYTGDTVISGGTLALARAAGDSYAGAIRGAGTLTLLDSGTVTLTGESSYAGATNLAGGTVALSGGSNRLPTTTTLNFTGSSGRLDVGSTSQQLAAMTVPTSGAVSLGIAGSGGTLAISGPDSLQIGPGGLVTSADSVTLEMSSLSTFSYTNTSSGVFRVGMQNSGNSGSIGEIARVTLAGSNTISANSILISDRGGNSDGGDAKLFLGQSNSLNANAMNVGYSGRSDATLAFAAGLTNPSATIRAKDGTSPLPLWLVGNVANFSSGTYLAQVDFSAGSLDAEVTELFLGNAVITNQTGRAGTQNASFVMGAGTLAVGTFTIGRIQADSGATVSNILSANGTLTIGVAGGQVVADSLVLAENTYLGGTTADRTVSGTIDLSAGTLAATSITLGAQTGNATATTSFNWTGGTIANKAGTSLTIASVPITLASGTGTFTAESGQSITADSSSPISGAGSLSKSGAGTLVLQGAHSYAGATSIAAGTLEIPGGASLATSGLDVASGATLDVSGLAGGLALASGQSLGGAGSILGSLVFGADSKLAFSSSLTVDSGTVSFNGFGVDDVVGLDGTIVSAGTYTLLDGTATFDLTNALNVGAGNAASIGGGKTAYFQQGSFQVVVVPEPAMVGLIALAVAGFAAARVRRSSRPSA